MYYNVTLYFILIEYKNKRGGGLSKLAIKNPESY